jgi:hypothetical protein
MLGYSLGKKTDMVPVKEVRMGTGHAEDLATFKVPFGL